MKLLVLAVLLAVSQTPSPVPRKTADHSSRSAQTVNQHADANKEPTVPPPVKNAASSDADEHKGQPKTSPDKEQAVAVTKFPSVAIRRDWIDYTAWLLTAALVIVGGIGVRFAYRTLKAIEGQLAEIKSAGEQTDRMIEHAGKQSEAALLSAKAVMSSERAWIVMEIIKENAGQFRLAATNYGRTPAQVVGYNIQHSFTIAESGLSPSPPEYSDSQSAHPQSQPFLVPDEEWTIETFSPNGIKRNVLGAPHPMLYWGVLRYKDIISNAEHDTWFCQRYDARRGEFVLAGPEGYNRYS